MNLWNNPVWNQLQHMQHEMNRLFDRWTGEGARALGLASAQPAVNMWEEDDHLYVEAELPGLDQTRLEILVTGGNQLTLKGERKAKAPDKAVAHRQERGFGSFSRMLTLPVVVDPDKVEARLENGVLHIKLAKHDAVKPRKIIVKSE